MVDQISKPGVEISQVFESTSPTPSTPSLVPCVVGPAFEVVEITGADGLASSTSKVTNSQGSVLYNQLPQTILPADFPTPHADPNQMTILNEEVQVGLSQSGTLNILDRDPGSAFLVNMNLGTQPAIHLTDAGLQLITAADKLIIAVDVVSRTNVTSDVVVDIAAQNVAQDYATIVNDINNAVGANIASLYSSGILLQSLNYGAAASITLRDASGAATSTAVTKITGSTHDSLRVEGAGLVATDNPAANVTTSTYLEYSRGKVFSGSTDITASQPGSGADIYQIDQDSNKIADQASEFLFSTNGLIQAATPTSDGDLLYASGPIGQSISAVMVTEVTNDRLRLGVVDTLRSTYDAEGNPTNQKYLDFNLGELANPKPFAPKNGYVIAQNLTGLNSSATAAYVESSNALNPTAATPATVTVGTNVVNATITANDGNNIVVSYGDSGVITNLTLVITSAMDESNIEAQLQALIDASALNTLVTVTYDAAANNIIFTTAATGNHITLTVTGTAFAISETTDSGTDTVLNTLNGAVLAFSFNDSSSIISLTSSTTSISDFVDFVNQSVGATVLSYGSNNKFKLSSYLVGVGSSVFVDSTTNALFLLSNNTMVDGTGRPNPDLHVAANGSVQLAPEISRHSLTGRPFRDSQEIHIGYRALRLDLSSSATQPGLIRVSNITDLESIYGPISTRNPLSLALYFALLNADSGVEVSALGLDEVSGSETEGTVDSYTRALTYLRTHEVYSIVPLTRSEDVIALFDAHVKDMSDPTNRAERVVITAPVNPIRRNDSVMLSTGSVGAQSTGTEDQIDLNASPEAALAAAGIDTSASIPFEIASGASKGRQLYLHLTIGSSSYRYSVASVDGARVTIRRTYTTAQNPDGYYNTEALPSEFVNATFSLALRGTALTLPGSTRLDNTAFAQTIRDKAQQYANRRQVRLFPDQVQTSAIGGINQSIPSYYFASALAGAVASLEPQEPFTRVPMVGFNAAVGPQLERSHLDIISAGNSVIEVDVQGQAPSLRMQSTTDPSTIEKREWSITKAVDFFAKQARAQLKTRIGRFNITQTYLDDLTILMDSLCNTAVDAGIFKGASLDRLEQDPAQPDTIKVEVTLEVLFPANYIKLTLVV